MKKFLCSMCMAIITIIIIVLCTPYIACAYDVEYRVIQNIGEGNYLVFGGRQNGIEKGMTGKIGETVMGRFVSRAMFEVRDVREESCIVHITHRAMKYENGVETRQEVQIGWLVQFDQPPVKTATPRPAPSKTPVPKPTRTPEPASGSIKTVNLGNGITMELVYLPGGTFRMGSDNGGSDEKPVHSVTISRGFYMGATEVTQAQYEAVIGSNPSYFKGSNLPVEGVTWFDAVRFCNSLSRKQGLPECYTIKGGDVTWNRNATGFRLPTEAEWEYACRAGSTGDYCFGNNAADLYKYGNYCDKQCEISWKDKNADDGYRHTSPVKSFRPNNWGLYDMHGNVWEWCWDWFDSYSSGCIADPSGPVSGSLRVLRGGSWHFDSGYCRSASRRGYDPSAGDDALGFRLVSP